MPRYKLTIEYDGTGYVGWQRQENGPSIQAALEAAVFAFTGEQVLVYGAGRTDAGVHALGQVAHLDLDRAFPVRTVRDAINAHLREERITILDATDVAADFHARFSARRRTYLYRILNRPGRPSLALGRVWHVKTPLDVHAMADAATVLQGRHDFTTFRATQCQARSPVKTLDACSVRFADGEIHMVFEARSFLHNQVRSMVGSLKMVGDGHWRREDLMAALAAGDRRRCGPVAPACGLYLTEIGYE